MIAASSRRGRGGKSTSSPLARFYYTTLNEGEGRYLTLGTHAHEHELTIYVSKIWNPSNPTDWLR